MKTNKLSKIFRLIFFRVIIYRYVSLVLPKRLCRSKSRTASNIGASIASNIGRRIIQT